MSSFRAAYFYFLAVKILTVRFLKNIYFSSNYYNKSLKTKLPEQLYFYPNSFLLSSFVNQKTFTFKFSKINIDTFWNDFESQKEEEDLNSFFWLNLISRKNVVVFVYSYVPGRFRKLREVRRKNFHSVAPPKTSVVPSYVQKRTIDEY